jgi:hypothetical protein
MFDRSLWFFYHVTSARDSSYINFIISCWKFRLIMPVLSKDNRSFYLPWWYGGHSAKVFSAKSFRQKGISEIKHKQKDFERRDRIAKNFSANCKVGETVNEGWGCECGWGRRFSILHFAILLFALCTFAEMYFRSTDTISFLSQLLS